VTYLDSDWALNPVVRRDVAVSELLSSLGGDIYPDRRHLLVDLLDVDENWHMHAVSDGSLPATLLAYVGERRRVQLAMGLLRPWRVLLLDEVTVDLDVLVRSELLDFLRQETESRVCTIVYCTHIFDGLAGWPTHLLKMSVGRVMAFDSMTELEMVGHAQNGSANSDLYEICLAWLKEDKVTRGKRGAEIRKKWKDLDEQIRGPLTLHDMQSSAHMRVERWKMIPAVKE
jgi:CCR4-NOT complex subunit CAF16